MSQENVEIVRAAMEAWNELGIEGPLPFYADDVEWHDPPELPDAGIHRGRAAVEAHLREFEAGGVFDLKLDIEELRSVGEEVLVLTRAHGRGVRSGTPSGGIDLSWTFLVRDGQVRRGRVFFDHAQALKAVGLSE